MGDNIGRSQRDSHRPGTIPETRSATISVREAVIWCVLLGLGGHQRASGAEEDGGKHVVFCRMLRAGVLERSWLACERCAASEFVGQSSCVQYLYSPGDRATLIPSLTAARQSSRLLKWPGHAGDMPPSLAADLLQFSQSLDNTVGDGTSEWTPGTVSSVCQWTGVQCYPANSSFALNFSNIKISGKKSP